MPQTEAAIERLALADRKNAGRRRYSSVAHNHTAVVQRTFWMKQGQHQFNRELGVERHASLLVNTNRSIAFDRDQRAELLVCELRNCLSDVVHGLTFLAR